MKVKEEQESSDKRVILKLIRKKLEENRNKENNNKVTTNELPTHEETINELPADVDKGDGINIQGGKECEPKNQ